MTGENRSGRIEALNNWEARWVMYKAAFGRRFTEMLDEKGWDKKYASGVFQVSETMIAHYMEGRNFPDTESFLRMCDTLDVSSDWLGGRSGVKKIQRNSDDKK